MSRLSDLYKAMETLQKEGISFDEKLEKQVSELEEKIIKQEIIPSLADNIEPLLKPIQRDLALLVEYHPGKHISVALTRQPDAAEALGAKLLELDPQAQKLLYDNILVLLCLCVGVQFKPRLVDPVGQGKRGRLLGFTRQSDGRHQNASRI